MKATEWLDRNEWPDLPVDSSAFSHYTHMSKIMEQYAREYHTAQLEKSRKREQTRFNNFL